MKHLCKLFKLHFNIYDFILFTHLKYNIVNKKFLFITNKKLLNSLFRKHIEGILFKLNKMIQDLIIEPTDYTPQVAFETNGTLLIKGRSLFLNSQVFYKPLIEWVRRLNVPDVTLTINLDYFDSSSLKKIFEILKIIDSNKSIAEFDVNWNFEKDDDAILEKGQIFKEKLKRTKFLFNEITESKEE